MFVKATKMCAKEFNLLYTPESVSVDAVAASGISHALGLPREEQVNSPPWFLENFRCWVTCSGSLKPAAEWLDLEPYGCQ
jgi:hypothetical protein